MKISHVITALLFVLSITACKDNSNNSPSIKGNSNKNLEKEVGNEFANLSSEDLNKHILAHYDLGQYEEGKEKLKFLMSDRPDLVDSLNLTELAQNFDEKLEEISLNKSMMAEKERKLRMPNATKNMRAIEKDNLTYYVDNSSPKFDSKETFHAYYTKDKAGVLKLYLKVKYIATSWLDIESYMFTVDQLDYDFTGEVVKTETKGKKKYKHETMDELIDTPQELDVLNAIINGKEVKAVYIGKSTYKERFLTEQQQIAIRNVLDAYLFSKEMNMPNLKEEYANNN